MIRLIFLAVFVFLAPHVVSQISNPGIAFAGNNLSEAELRQALTKTCDQVNAYYQTEHFPIPVPSPALCSFAFKSDPNYQEPIGFFDLDQNHELRLEAKVLAKSGRVVSFANFAAFHEAYGVRAHLYSEKPAPKWTKDKAVEMASKFAAIFVQPWGNQLGKPNATFDWQFTAFDKATHSIKFKEGEWSITLRRVTASGIPFLTDGVQMGLSENYGPSIVNVFFRAQYNGEDDHITPLAKDKTLIEAYKGLARLLASPSGKSWLPGGQSKGNPEMALYIVCPNDLQTNKSMLDMVYAQQGKGRLAWVVTYAVYNPSTPAVTDQVSVYIDAKNGSFLGGTL